MEIWLEKSKHGKHKTATRRGYTIGIVDGLTGKSTKCKGAAAAMQEEREEEWQEARRVGEMGMTFVICGSIMWQRCVGEMGHNSVCVRGTLMRPLRGTSCLYFYLRMIVRSL